MPGRRNLARERAHHAATHHDRFRSTVAALAATYPDRALIGSAAILRYLHNTLELRRRNGDRLTWRIITSWRRDHACPILPGYLVLSSTRAALARCPALTTTHALTAWTLTRFASGLLFSVSSTQQSDAVEVSASATQCC
jgi:hypothetical protein